MNQDKIEIASGACVLLGADQIQSFDEDTTEALAARSFYDDVYETLLSERMWSFAKERVSLQQLAKTSVYGYKYVYRLSVDALSLVTIGGAEVDYKLISGREIHTDMKAATADILIKPDEKVLPGYFVIALKYMLAATFAPTVTDDSSQTERFLKQANVLLKNAANRDAVQSPLSYAGGVGSTLAAAHRGGRF